MPSKKLGSANNSSSGGAGNGFKPLGLSEPVYRGVIRMGFRNPTPVQRKALPVVMSGADSAVMARTGSGKTVAFLIPLIETLLASDEDKSMLNNFSRGVRAVVLSPTRELSLQTLRVLKKISHFTDIKSIGIHGGERMDQQFDDLSSKPDVVIATPGRLAHILSEIPDFTLRDCQICILDEADRLLEMGFAQQIREISKSIPERCQKVLLSATMPKMLIEFTKGGFMTDPQVVRLDNEVCVSDELRISFVTCRSLEKDAGLLQIMGAIEDDKEANEATRTGLTLVFCATRHHVEYVTTLLRASGQEATLIYGTLDPDARNSNLAAFRNGRKPILVVTDVAARGVDIPMCDHVIHYHFPPSPKLFVHRSGRVARAGRIGFCFALVEPDELPYMVDLHLFLGRRLSTADGVTNTSTKRESNKEGDESYYTRNDEDDSTKIESYKLHEMTPEMIHYGSIPESILTLEVENVHRIKDSEMAGSEQAELMRALGRVSGNAMKQYRRTRPEASREGVRRAKAILEGQKLKTGERIGGFSIPPHPLLRGMEMEQYEEAKSKGKIGTLNDLDNVRKRQEFLKAVSQFRPKETVFEAFATGGGKETGVLSQVDKGRTIGSSKKNDTSYALKAMKSMRRQMKMARDKGAVLVVAGSELAEEIAHGDEGEGIQLNPDKNEDSNNEGEKSSLIDSSKSSTPILISKPRISKAERRRLKKKNETNLSVTNKSSHDEKRGKNMRGRDFRDNEYFIENDTTSNTQEAQRQRQIEAAMQPSAASSSKGWKGNALRLEEAMLDVVGDENDQLVQKQRMMRWDKSKRKYVQTTVGAELSGESYSKRVKLESGQIVKKDKLKLGEIYEKWQKKTNRSVGRNGVFDNAGEDDDTMLSHGRQNGKRRGGKQSNTGNNMDAPKSAQSIKMSRDRSQDMKMKNMNKSDRRRVERNSSNDDQRNTSKEPPKKGSQGKRGMSGRWKK
mmetsp:Transcript_24297/g.27110  ORF Transcript_24297/g.27110 Transcript_24297/m.27110 type:complete len:962 (+) Transcript_24297:77-2962(+)